jgi:glutamate/tyrosine decarboxylase-like PLP-dependent enzyme
LHVDAAYGGYFTLVDELDAATRASFDALPAADSIVIDPHKHGLQPLGCSCVLFHEPDDAQDFRHRSPCADSQDPHAFAEGGFECSRSGAAAVALWATMRELPLVRDGEFARMLRASRAAALALYAKLRNDSRFFVTTAPDLDIVVWAVADDDAECASSLARDVQAECERRGLHLSLTQVAWDRVTSPARSGSSRSPRVTGLRAVLMKPEHLDWVERMYAIIGEAASAALQQARRNARTRSRAASLSAD